MKQLAVVILNWNGGEMVSRCVQSLAPEFSPSDIFVIDNKSTDDSIQNLKYTFPEVNVQGLDQNYGFAGGYNHGLPSILEQYEFVLLLNNDTMVEAGFGSSVQSFLSGLRPEVGMVAVRMVLHPSQRIDNYGLVLHPSGLGFNAKHQNDRIVCPSGGAALYRSATVSDVLEKTGEIFDSHFGFYNEDLDLGLRARMLGWLGVQFVGKAVFHAHGKSVVKRGNTFALYHAQRNQLWMVAKDYPASWWWQFGWQVVVVQLVEVVYHCLRGNAATIFRAKWDGIIGLPRMWKKRSWLRQAKSIPPGLFAPTFSLGTLWRASVK